MSSYRSKKGSQRSKRKMASQNRKSNSKDEIRRNLQRVYDEALQEEIPNEFIEMIARLKAEKDAKSDDK